MGHRQELAQQRDHRHLLRRQEHQQVSRVVRGGLNLDLSLAATIVKAVNSFKIIVCSAS